MLRYIMAFALATVMLTFSGHAGCVYFAVAALVSLIWLVMAWKGFQVTDDRVWARQLFIFSIVAITSLSLMMSVDVQGSGMGGDLFTLLK